MLIIISFWLFWKLKLQNISMPIEHRIGCDDGQLSLSIGKVREIRIRGNGIKKNVDVSINVFDNMGSLIWKGEYKKCNFENDVYVLDTFTKEVPLLLPLDDCTVKYYISGCDKKDINLYFIEYSGSLFNLYTVLCVFVILIYILVLYFAFRKNICLHKAYICLMLSLGFLYSFILPPLSAPDEQAHFLESYRVSSVLLGSDVYDDNGKQLIRQTDYDAMEYLHNIASISGWYKSFDLLDDNENKMISSFYTSTVSTKAPYAYLIPGITIAIARKIHLSGHLLLLLGRYSNLILFSILVSISIRIIPYGKEFFFIVGLLPESIYLFSSYSYDGLNLALCMLITAYFIRLYHSNEKIYLKEILLLGILILFMIPIKVVYISYGLLIFLLPRNCIKLSKKQIGTILLIVIIGIAIYVITSLNGVLSTIGDIKSDKPYEYGSVITVSYIKDNIEQTIITFISTILENSSSYLEDALGAVVGRDRFGDYLSYRLPSWMKFSIFILMLMGLEDTKRNMLSKQKRCILVISGWMMYLLILTSMYFACTKVGNATIGGVQGRYLLPIIVLLPAVITNSYFTLNVDKKRYCLIGIGVIDLLYAFFTFYFYACNYFI